MQFYFVDVFAEEKYQGNQLAVFLVDSHFTTNDMQRIAREINFSETTFILSAEKQNGGYNVRIFTPDVEVPFAGHPTLGTAFIISRIIESGKQTEIILNLGVGQIPVTFADQNKSELWMKQKAPIFSEIISPQTIANILQISVLDIDTRFPIQSVSTGLPAVVVPIKTLAAVKRCKIQQHEFQAFLDTHMRANLLVFSTETVNSQNDLHARVFMDDSGFLEDPATGSANGNLAGYLLKHEFFGTTKIDLRVEQGYEMQRPSLLKIRAEKIAGKYNVEVGGTVFLVAQGQLL